MAQANKICQICGEKGHSKFYCDNRPAKPIRQVSIRRQLELRSKTKPSLRHPIKQAATKQKKKKSPLDIAKDAAWDSFSIYIRTRDCIRFTGNPVLGRCVTCPEDKSWRPFKELQAGHFIASRRNSVLFDEDIVYTQCYGCNIGKGGNYVDYFVFMEEEWGLEKIEEFRARKNRTVQYRLHDFIELQQLYTDKTTELLKALRL